MVVCYMTIHILHYRKKYEGFFSDVTNKDEDTNGIIYSPQLGLYNPVYTSNKVPKVYLQIELKRAFEKQQTRKYDKKKDVPSQCF